jgi:hypothetical protein
MVAVDLALAASFSHDDNEERKVGLVIEHDHVRPWRVLRYIGWGLVLAVAGAGARFAWSVRHAPAADPAAYAAAIRDPAVQVQTRGPFLLVRPAQTTPQVGILFYPGALIEPAAYVAKLAGSARTANAQIVIGRPPLKLSIFVIGQADHMRATAPEIRRWYVAGHSLGGAAACMHARRRATQLGGDI